MEKWAFESLAKLFLKNEKTPDVQIFQGLDLLPMPSLKKISKKALLGAKKQFTN